MSEIKIKVLDSGHLELNQLVHFQGELKSLSDENFNKLKNEIINKGFRYPFFIWKSPEGKNNIIDGHQRLRVLMVLEQEGFVVPPLPVVYLDAQDEAEARDMVLAAISKYGDIDPNGLIEFISHGVSGSDELTKRIQDMANSYNLPDVDVNTLISERAIRDLADNYQHVVQNTPQPTGEPTDPRAEWVGMPEFNQEDKKSFRYLIVHFADEQSAKEFFELIRQSDTGKTKSIWFPPQEKMETKAKRYE
jgi:hypothetical protein